MTGRTIMAIVSLALMSPAAAMQQNPPAISADLGQSILAGCVAHSSAKRQSHAIAVVDAGGQLVAALRMDGNGWGIMDFAIAKARAVAAWGFPTAQMADAVRETPGFADAPHVVTVGGGVPIFDATGRHRIGGVGVSGEAPVDDASCAVAGIEAAGLRSSRSPG